MKFKLLWISPVNELKQVSREYLMWILEPIDVIYFGAKTLAFIPFTIFLCINTIASNILPYQG